MKISIKCDRCNETVDGIKCDNFTGGFYDVREGCWHEYSKNNENFICDKCMFSDEKYIKIYGKQKS